MLGEGDGGQIRQLAGHGTRLQWTLNLNSPTCLHVATGVAETEEPDCWVEESRGTSYVCMACSWGPHAHDV